MTKFKGFRWGSRNPLTIVELIIAVMTIAGGLYLLSPTLVIELNILHYPGLAAAITSQIGIIAVAATAIAAGLATIIGVWKRNYRLRSIAMFTNIMLRLYAYLAAGLISSFLPLNFPAVTLILICSVCWLQVKGMVARGYGD